MYQEEHMSIRYLVYPDIDALASDEQMLLQRAKAINQKAYAPYSNFFVSACLLLANGKVIEGVNQENAAYPSGLCAERVAFFGAGVMHPDIVISKIAIVAKPKNGDYNFTPPCGACRQSMLEFEIKQKSLIEVLLPLPDGKIYKLLSIKDLLPFSFGESNLSQSKEP